MIKEFTTIVPDRLYFSEVSGNKTASYVYDGPTEIKVNVTDPFNPIYIKDEDLYDENDTIITVNADSETKAAYYLYPPATTEAIFEEEVLSDGSIFLNNTNPSLEEYYSISYNKDTSAFEYHARPTKQWKTANLLKAETMLITIQTGILARIQIDNGGNQAVKDFLINNGEQTTCNLLTPDQIVDKIEQFVAVLENYIEQEKQIITWKYVNLPVSEFPEIPDILQNTV